MLNLSQCIERSLVIEIAQTLHHFLGLNSPNPTCWNNNLHQCVIFAHTGQALIHFLKQGNHICMGQDNVWIALKCGVILHCKVVPQLIGR